MRRDRSIRDFQLGAGAICAMLILTTQQSRADESGISFWLPGQVSSLPAVPQGAPGWSMGTVYYHTSVAASGSVAAAREIQVGRFAPTVNVSLNASLNAQADLLLLNPTYTFDTPLLGGQLAMGVTGIFGRSAATIDGTLTANVGGIRGNPDGEYRRFDHVCRRPLSDDHAQMEFGRQQLHDVCNRRHSGRRLRSKSHC